MKARAFTLSFSPAFIFLLELKRSSPFTHPALLPRHRSAAPCGRRSPAEAIHRRGQAIAPSSRAAVIPKGEWKLCTISHGQMDRLSDALIFHDQKSHTRVLDASPLVRIPSRSPSLTPKGPSGMFRALPYSGSSLSSPTLLARSSPLLLPSTPPSFPKFHASHSVLCCVV